MWPKYPVGSWDEPPVDDESNTTKHPDPGGQETTRAMMRTLPGFAPPKFWPACRPCAISEFRHSDEYDEIGLPPPLPPPAFYTLVTDDADGVALCHFCSKEVQVVLRRPDVLDAYCPTDSEMAVHYLARSEGYNFSVAPGAILVALLPVEGTPPVAEISARHALWARISCPKGVQIPFGLLGFSVALKTCPT